MIYYKIDIQKVEERYIIYDNGKIFDKKRSKYCKLHLDSKGYLRVWISTLGKNISVHRLVMCKYKPNVDEIYLQIKHIDGKKTNNNVDNLEWCTQPENIKHAFNNNLLNRRGIKNPQDKLSENEIKEIIYKLLNDVPIKKISEEYGVSKSLISRIRSKRTLIEYTKDINFPISKYSNNYKALYEFNEDELLKDLEDNIDIDIISNKYHLSKRFIRDYKYKKLGKY